MMKIFRKSEEVIGATVDTIDHMVTPETPLAIVPTVTSEHPTSLGDDFNLVLLVKEHGSRRIMQLSARRKELLAELHTVDTELAKVQILVDAALKL